MITVQFANRVRRPEVAGPLLITLILIAWRFLNVGLAPFIRDEPTLQTILDQEISAGRIPLLGLTGSYGLRYGPTAMWFYWPARLFTANAQALILWHSFAFAAAFGFFFAAVRRSAGEVAACWATLLAASSPLLFFYSRLAWDNTLLTLITALLLHELVRLRARATAQRFLALGFISGLALNLHPMATPVVLAAIFCAWPALSSGKMCRNFLLTALPIAAQLALYTAGLKLFWDHLGSREDFLVSTPSGYAGYALSKCGLGFMQFFTPASLLGILGGALPASLTPNAMILFSTFGWAASVATGWASVASMALRRPANVAAQFALASLGLGLQFYLFVRPDQIYPHYFTPYWWVGFYAFGLAIGSRTGASRVALQAFALSIVGINVLFLATMLRFLEHNEGTRELSYGTTVRETERLTEQLCNSMPEGTAVLHLAAVPGVTSPPIQYFAAHLGACRGRIIHFYPYVSQLLTPVHYEVRYGNSSPTDASLVLNPIPAQHARR